jgi:hypothetical protein
MEPMKLDRKTQKNGRVSRLFAFVGSTLPLRGQAVPATQKQERVRARQERYDRGGET